MLEQKSQVHETKELDSVKGLIEVFCSWSDDFEDAFDFIKIKKDISLNVSSL
jgi:hypothetical protein